jgi:hypothetical protein
LARSNGLSDNRIEKLIKFGAKNQVKSLKLANLGIEIEFFEKTDENKVGFGKTSKKESETHKELEELRKEIELDELKFMSPSEYEDKIAYGEIDGR